MAASNGEREDAWIEKVRSEGAVPLLAPENCPNGWSTPSGNKFMVRGSNYLSDKVKIPGGEFLLKPLGFDWIKSPAKIGEVLNHPSNRVRKAINQAIATGTEPFVWAFNLQIPSKENYSAIAYFITLEPIQEGSLMDAFLKGDDARRNSRLKLIANIVKGPWIVRTAVGEQAICLLGRALTCKYTLGLNFIEVDVDIGSSMVANAIVHLALGYITTLTVDLAFLIESQTASELPEQILGAVRFSELNPASACLYELHSEESSGNMQSSLPTRFWKSLGQSFSNLLQQGNQDGSTSSSEHINGRILDENEDEHTEKWNKCKARATRLHGSCNFRKQKGLLYSDLLFIQRYSSDKVLEDHSFQRSPKEPE